MFPFTPNTLVSQPHEGAHVRTKSALLFSKSQQSVGSGAVNQKNPSSKSGRWSIVDRSRQLPYDVNRVFVSTCPQLQKNHALSSSYISACQRERTESCLSSDSCMTSESFRTRDDESISAIDCGVSAQTGNSRERSITTKHNFLKSQGFSRVISVGQSSVIDGSRRLCMSCSTRFEAGSSHSVADISVGSTDIATVVCNIFWKLKLTFHPYQIEGDHVSPVDFSSLWLNTEQMKDVLPDICQNMPECIEWLCFTALYTNISRLLITMIELNIVGVNQVFDDLSLLHIACLARNLDAVQYLVSVGANPSLRDSHGQTAIQMSFCQQVSQFLLARSGQADNAVFKDNKDKRQSPSLMEKRMIFRLTSNFLDANKLIFMLQKINFDVNFEKDATGDLLLHNLVKSGLCQLPVILLLVQHFKADINAHNVDGMTCLMLACSYGDALHADALICVAGADPNCKNSLNGWTALHYSCYEKHTDVVEILLKRGADTNLENNQGMRPDELSTACKSIDCRNIVIQVRNDRMARLRQLIRQDKLTNSQLLRHSDQFNVDGEGFTLLMMAARMGSLKSLKLLLKLKGAPVNAQHEKTLGTALVLASVAGCSSSVELLLRHNANPAIRDKDGLLALHHAVLSRNIKLSETLLQFSSALTGLQKALQLTGNDSSEIKALLEAASLRRQKEIVMPALFELASSGNVEGIYAILEEGDDTNPVSSVGDWPLYLAVQNGHLEVVKLLCEWNGDVLSRNPGNDGNTVLHVCCLSGHTSVAELLLKEYEKHQAELMRIYDNLAVNILNKSGNTPLMLAASRGYVRLVKLLIDKGASTSVLRPDGKLYQCTNFIGVEHILENHHKFHSTLVFGAIANKKEGLKKLKNIFVPKHDHNLSDPTTGDSPLMRACFLGRKDVVSFLLQSAVYSMFEGSGRESNVFIDDLDHEETIAALVENMHTVCPENPVIIGYQVNHIYAANSRDGSTAFHRTVEGGDNVNIVECLLEADEAAVNVQNMAGLSPLHLACKLNRTKIAKKLIKLCKFSFGLGTMNKQAIPAYHELHRKNMLESLPFVDLNMRTLDGSLPEDMASNKSIVQLIQKARSEITEQSSLWLADSRRRFSLLSANDASSTGQTSFLDFDKINSRFMKLKEQHHVVTDDLGASKIFLFS